MTVFRLVLVKVMASIATAAPVTQPAGGPASRPARDGAAAADRPAVAKVELPIVGRDEAAFYLLQRPAEYELGQRPPLLIALHGTDDSAREILDFWAGLPARLPMLIATPQAVGRGWGDDDLPAIRAMLAHLQAQVSYDEGRVLLAGFSAGGAMSLHLLYKEEFPATAVAALANYVPPRITDAEVNQRRHVPVFYAVGMTDVNYERMRDGLARLRSAGGNVNLYRPQIGHVLDPQVGRVTLEWFFDQCARQVVDTIESAGGDTSVARAVAELQSIIDQHRWHEPDHVRQALEVLVRVEAPGRRELQEARELAAAGRFAEAAEKLQQIEADHAPTKLGRQAGDLRRKIEADPAARQQLADRAARRQAEAALAMYASAQKLVAQGKLSEAADHCRRIIAVHGDTPTARRARYLLEVLETRITP